MAEASLIQRVKSGQSIKLTNLLPLFVHVGALGYLAWLAWDWSAGNLSVNPVQDLTQRTGKGAIVLLLLSLAVTPANTLFGFKKLIPARRTLGLYAFFFAVLHFLIFIGVDYRFDWSLLLLDAPQKRYIWMGLATLLVLLPLAVTSFPGWMKRLGPRWKRLHRLAYLAGALAVVHFAWVVKGDVLSLQGDIIEPLLFGLVLAFLLLLRLPPLRRRITRLRQSARSGASSRPAS